MRRVTLKKLNIYLPKKKKRCNIQFIKKQTLIDINYEKKYNLWKSGSKEKKRNV